MATRTRQAHDPGPDGSTLGALPLLAGRYERRRLLGAGATGQVYQGHDRLLDRPVAVKTLHAHFAGRPAFVAGLVREATAAASLNHPNVVAVYDAGSDEDVHFIVMEYAPGRTLRQVLDAQGPLAPERAATVASDIALALAAAHDRGLVHRDVKPGNVIVTPAGQVKVVDFGIARVTGGASVTDTAELIGTPLYLAPEQAQGGSPDVRSDLYALGVCLYELLTGVPPFTGDNAVALAYLHVNSEPRPPRQLRPDLPRALEAVVLKAMAKDPGARYQTAAALRADLERVIGADRMPVITAPPRGQVRRSWPRRTRFLSLAVAGVFLGGSAAVLPLEQLRDGQRAAPGTTTEEIRGITVPYLRGLTLEAARVRLRRVGLSRPPTIRQQADPAVPRGRVLGTDPPADAQVTAGTGITLTVSSGPAPTSRPSGGSPGAPAAAERRHSSGTTGSGGGGGTSGGTDSDTGTGKQGAKGKAKGKGKANKGG